MTALTRDAAENVIPANAGIQGREKGVKKAKGVEAKTKREWYYVTPLPLPP
jgi:hypothetical protein